MAGAASIGDGSSSISRSASAQGQTSWTSLVTTAFTSTVGDLSRVSAAGVDPYTVVIGQKLGAQFQMSAAGRKQMTDALLKLPSFQSIGKALSFGFGSNHLVRVMGKTEEGQLCLALCSSLCECYETDIAAQVLVEMVQTSQAPENLRPSVLQWRDLLDVSNGILSPTTFPEQAEKLMALHPGVHGLGFGILQGSDFKTRGCSSPESLAKALLAISEITRGELSSITITGNADAGWIAAFAEWHFQLTVQITLSDSRVLYQNHPEGQQPQVLVIYQQVTDGDEPHIQTIGRTYRLTNVTEMIQRENRGEPYGAICAAGRTTWATALQTVFGTDFTRLLEVRRALGGAIGCLARIMKAIATAESSIDQEFRHYWQFYEKDSYGRGFVAHITTWFPELAALRNFMDDDAKLDVATAIARYEGYVSTLKAACQCSVCEGTFTAQETYCFVLILESIIRVAQMLSILDLPILLGPSRLGLEQYYYDQYFFHLDIGDDRTKVARHEKLGAPYFALDSYVYSSSVLDESLKLFCGRAPYKQSLGGMNPNAISNNGICAYWSALGRESGGRLSGRITVTTGQIQLHEKSYKLMLDAQTSRIQVAQAFKWQGALSFSDMEVVVKETPSALKIHFEFPESTKEKGKTVRLMPAIAIDSYIKKKGLVSCHPAAHSKPIRLVSQADVQEMAPGHTLYDINGVRIDVYEANMMQQWALLPCLEIDFFVQEECIECNLAAAMERYGKDMRKRDRTGIIHAKNL